MDDPARADRIDVVGFLLPEEQCGNTIASNSYPVLLFNLVPVDKRGRLAFDKSSPVRCPEPNAISFVHV